jgi:AbrB family looped-hinge helix DNA binding protein
MTATGFHVMSNAVVSEGGRVVIPAEMRAKFDLNVGDKVVWREEADGLVLLSLRASIKRTQALVAKYNKHPKRSVVDELIAERRAEAAKE